MTCTFEEVIALIHLLYLIQSRAGPATNVLLEADSEPLALQGSRCLTAAGPLELHLLHVDLTWSHSNGDWVDDSGVLRRDGAQRG